MRNPLRRQILATEPDYYARLLLSNNSWQSVCFSSLLASEILLAVAMAVGLAWAATGSSAAWLQALLRYTFVLPRYLAAGIGVSAIQLFAALLAKWGQLQRWSGRTISLALHFPVTFVVFVLIVSKYLHYLSAIPPIRDSAGEILIENVVVIAPTVLVLIFLGSAVLTYFIWATWWMVLLLILEKKGDVDIWKIIDETTKDRHSSFLAEYRYCLNLRKEAAWEKKHRWLLQNQNTRTETLKAKQPRLLHPLAVVLVVVTTVAGTIWWQEAKAPLTSYEPIDSTVPKSVLSFWFEGTAKEADIIFSLVEIYNKNAINTAIIQAHHVPRLEEAIGKASIVGELPDILLANNLLAERVVYASSESADSSRISLPVWKDRPWRPDLSIVIVGDGVNHEASHNFASYLIERLTEQ